MGVAGFFSDIVKKYPDTIFWNPTLKIEYFFMDFNCFIYNCAYELQQIKKWDFSIRNDELSFQKQLIQYTIEKTAILVNNIVKPTKLLYIAIDGSPPLVKMRQQRERRYRRVFDNEFLEKHFPNTFIKNKNWRTSNISPGTVFLTQLCKEFINAIRKNIFGKKINVIFSGADVPGEAEHKFLPLINNIKNNKNENYCVFSEDADQIILSLRFPKKNFYIMRTIAKLHPSIQQLYPDEQEFIYVNVASFIKKMKDTYQIDIYDYIFLTFLEGNDFVKPLFTLKFKDDRLRTLLEIYSIMKQKNKNTKFITNTPHINIKYNSLLQLFKHLAEKEYGMITAKRARINKEIRIQKWKEPMTIENYDIVPIYSNKNPYFTEFLREWNSINETQKNSTSFFDINKWKQRYYEHFFGTHYNLDKICYDYIHILLFNTKYYFGEEPEWNYEYDALTAPFASDIYKYLSANPNIINNLYKISNNTGNPYPTVLQLMYILPPQDKDLLPKPARDALYGKNSTNTPSANIRYDYLTGSSIRYLEPILSHISMPKLVATYQKARSKFNKNNFNRNTIKTDPFIHQIKT